MKKKVGFKNNREKVQVSYFKVGLAGLLFVFMIWACDDIFETDLSGKKIVIIAPGDSIHTDISTQTFSWEALTGAISYNLQIVTPTFNKVQALLLDSNVINHSFVMNLTPGHYEWRVRAQNGSSHTDYFVRSFDIDSTLDLTKQSVILNSPVDGAITNSKDITFQWGSIYNATNYIFEVGQSDLNGTLLIDTIVTTFKVIWGVGLADGSYVWGVQAKNSNTNTNFTTHKITIDRTAPAIPVLSTPLNKTQLSSWSVDLSWNRVDSDGGSPLYDSVYVAIDTFFTSKVSMYKSTTKNQSITLSEDTTYFWKVRTVDEAGNRSSSSAIQKFSVKTK